MDKLETRRVEILTRAQQQLALSGSAVGAAQIEARAAIQVHAIAEERLAAAIETGNVQLIRSATALNVEAAAAERAALAILAESRSARGSATSHEQFGRAIQANTASMFGLRGAVLAASQPFILGTVAAIAFAKSIREASDQTEEINKTLVVFQRSGGAILEWSRTTATALGIARVEALQAANQFGAILVPMGVIPQRAAIMSQSLVQLASDMASFNNVDPGRALEALRAGLVGQTRPLRVLGVQLTAARVNMEAMAASGKKSAADLTQQEKILARYRLILKDAAIQMGDFQATQDRLANQSRILRAQITDLSGELGSALIPAVLLVTTALNDLADAVQTDIDAFKDLVNFVGRVSPLKFVIDLVLPGGAKDHKKFFNELKGGFEATAGAALLAVGTAADIGLGAGIPIQVAGAALIAKGLQDVRSAAAQAAIGSDQVHESLGKLKEDFKDLTGPGAIAGMSIKLQEMINTMSRGGPIGKRFAAILAEILAGLQTGKFPVHVDLEMLFDRIQARQEVERWWGIARDSVERGLSTKTILAKIPVSLSFDVSAAVGEAFGTDATQLARLQAQRDAARRRLIRQLGLDPNATTAEILAASTPQALQNAQRVKGFSEKRLQAINEAANAFSSANSQITTILNNQATAAENAKTKQEQAAKDAADAQAKATQTFIDNFLAGRETLLRRRLERAGNTETIADDLRINEGLRRVLRARRKAIHDRIRDLNLHGDALKIAQAAFKALGDQIASLDATIARETDDLTKEGQAAAAANRAARMTHLEAMLAIAETTPGKVDDRRALEAIIAADTRRINFLKAKSKKTREEKAELDALLVDRAQRNQALRELTDETKKSKSDMQKLKEAEFAFLQTQQGFTASLIGNLIPGGLTSGLVGGTSASAAAAAAAGPRQVAGGFEQPRGPAASAVGTRPVSSGQGNTQIALLREIRNLLRKLNMGNEHPEAKNQRSTGAAAMDYSRSDMAMGIG